MTMTKQKRDVIEKYAYDMATLSDWYQSSIDETHPSRMDGCPSG